MPFSSSQQCAIEFIASCQSILNRLLLNRVFIQITPDGGMVSHYQHCKDFLRETIAKSDDFFTSLKIAYKIFPYHTHPPLIANAIRVYGMSTKTQLAYPKQGILKVKQH